MIKTIIFILINENFKLKIAYSKIPKKKNPFNHFKTKIIKNFIFEFIRNLIYF